MVLNILYRSIGHSHAARNILDIVKMLRTSESSETSKSGVPVCQPTPPTKEVPEAAVVAKPTPCASPGATQTKVTTLLQKD